MKKVIIFLIIVAYTLVLSVSQFKSYAQNNDSSPILVIHGQRLVLHVGETLDLNDKFFAYVDNYEDLIWRHDEIGVIYFVEERLVIYALKAGEIVVNVRNEDFSLESHFTIEVEKVDLYGNGGFDDNQVGDTWTSSGQTHGDWRLWTGTGGPPVRESQTIKIIEDYDINDELSKMLYIEHLEPAHFTLTANVAVPEPGHYYIEFDSKGSNISSNGTFVRVNINAQSSTMTTTLTGSFDWRRMTSNSVEVKEGDLNLSIEFYGTRVTGEFWYDNVTVHKVIKTDYLGYDLNTSLIGLRPDESFQVISTIYPETIINHMFHYEILDPSIAEVTPDGLVVGIDYGTTTLVVTDQLYGLSKRIQVIIGTDATFEAPPINLTVKEDHSVSSQVVVSGNENDIIVYKYTNPLYGKYYIDNEMNIVYTPNRDFNSEQKHVNLGTTPDYFQVIAYERDKGYRVVDVQVYVQAETDNVIIIDFWHSVEKNITLTTGYLEIVSADIEVEIPYERYTELSEYGLLNAKRNAYEHITATLVDGSLSGTTDQGGSVSILYNGQSQLIQDRYYVSTRKVIFGTRFEYTPAQDFIGYDTFDMIIDHEGIEKQVTATVYVLPEISDFKFNETDFSGVYVVGNDEWFLETREAYQNGEPYIKAHVDYYAALFNNYNPTGVPSRARTPMEQAAIMYQVTGEQRYAEMAWQQIYEVTKNNTFAGGDGTKRASWGEGSNGFLDGSMVTYSVAFAYNLIVETLDDDQKRTVVTALYEEGFYWFENINNNNVTLHGNNHSLVIGGNLVIAALSVMSYEGDIEVTVENRTFTVNVKEMAADVVTYAYKLLQIALVHYSKSGGYPEGPGYSYYAHRNIVAMLATLKNIYGSEGISDIYSFGLSDIDGILNYPYYSLYTYTPNDDHFIYNENLPSLSQPGLLWYARIDESYIPFTIVNQRAMDLEIYSAMNLAWYKPYSFDNLDPTQNISLDYLLEVHEVAAFRNRFGDYNGIYAALKGFNPLSDVFAHKSLDSGTFEIVAYGKKFIENFSNETYALSVPPGFWDFDYGRWQYYKKQPQGHNVVVFNPVQYPMFQQDPYAYAPIDTFVSQDGGGYAVITLTDVYKDMVTSYYRGLSFNRETETITIQDEFLLREESEFYWAAHTRGNIEIISEKLASITIDGRRLYAQINSKLGSFSVMPGIPLPGSFGLFHNLDNDGINKLIIHEENVVEGVISVTFTPSIFEIELTEQAVVSLDDWTVSNVNTARTIRANDITFDAPLGRGTQYQFNPTQYTYFVDLDATVQTPPNLVATYDQAKYDVEIYQAKYFGEPATVKLTDKTSGQTEVYTYRFRVNTRIDLSESFVQIVVKEVIGNASDVQNLLTDDRTEVYHANNRDEVLFEFENVEQITNIAIRFSGGARYQYYFDIYAGETLDDMKNVYYAGQSNQEIGDEIYALGQVNAKYVKIVFKGNTEDYGTSVTQVRFFNDTALNTLSVDENSNIMMWILIGSGIAVLVIGGLIATKVVVSKRKKS